MNKKMEWNGVCELSSFGEIPAYTISEQANASVSGRYAGTKAANKQLHFHLKPACAAVLLAFAMQTAQANPIGASVVNGQASFATTGNTLTVTNTPGAIINWQGFSIGANEITRFAQQSASSAVLNRVTSSNPSSILGTLQSNGRVFLINPNGIVFGAGATIDVAGLVASTLNLSNADFLAERYHFTQVPGAQNISNAGNLTAQSGGQIYLIAPNVENTGVITAPNGEILLAAGHSVELVNSNDPSLRVNITAPAGDATNVGQLIASSGSLGLFGTVVRNSGTVNADSATLQGGKIVFKASQRVEAGGTVSAQGVGGGDVKLLADMQNGTVNVAGTVDASAPNGGDGGFIETSAHTVLLNNPTITATAPYGKGGTWLIDPTDVLMDAAYNAPIVTSLNAGTNVTVATVAAGVQLGDITVAANIAKTTGADATLTLQAHNNIIVNGGVTISSTSNKLNVVFNADSDGLNGGNIQMNAGSSIVTNGGNITFAGGVGGLGAAVGSSLPGSAWSGAAEGIYLTGATLNASGGNIVMSGTGAAGIPAGGDGIYITSNSVVQTSGAGTITLNGTGGAGGAGSSSNSGVRLGTGAQLSSVNGAIALNGQGGAGNNSNYGLYVHNSATITSIGTGTITLVGTAGGTGNNPGMRLSSGMQITSANGDISITGQGAGTGVGIVHTNTSGAITSTGSASITLDGRGAGGAEGINTAGVIHGSTSTGNVTLIADTATGADSIVLSRAISGSGNLLLQPLNPATTIGIAGGAGTFNLSAGELGTIQPGFASITIGRANGTGLITFGSGTGAGYTFNANTVIQNPGVGSAGITIADPLSTGLYNLTLNCSGTNLVSNSITAGALRLLGTGIFSFGNTSNDIGTLAANVTGHVTYNDTNGFIIGSITSFDGTAVTTTTGVTTNNGDFAAVANNGVTPGNITLNTGSAINTGTGAIYLSATGGNLNINGNVSGGAFTLNGGTWNQVAATLPGFTVNDFKIWGGTFIRALVGDGSITNPYQLADIYGVQGMGSAGMLSKSYVLANNIDATGAASWAGFMPVGNGFTAFTGTLDGLGHTISNLTINRWSSYAGLFGYTSSGANIRNVGLVGGSISGDSYVGGLVGYNNGTIINSFASGSVNGTGSKVGGLVGHNYYGTISNSYATGIVAGNSYVGGLVGYNENDGGISINNAYASGSVTGASYIGGLVGYNTWGNEITNIYATGAVTGAGSYVGGLVGYNNGTVTSGFANGVVRNSGWYTGGLVGENGSAGVITSSHADGNVTGTGSSYQGGLVGKNYGLIEMSYATGAVTGTSDYVGGLVGRNKSSGIIRNSYATGSVSGPWDVGGLVGENDDGTISNSYATGLISGTGPSFLRGGLVGDNWGSNLTNNYWNTDTSGILTSDGGGTTGLNTAQMMAMANFTGWSIANTGGAGMTWRIYEGHTAPLLASFLTPLAVSGTDSARIYTPSTIIPSIWHPGTSVVAGNVLGVGGGLYSVQLGYDITDNITAAPAPAPGGFIADLMNMILIPGGGASGSSQSTISTVNNKKPPPTVVAVNGEILPADSNAQPLPVCRR